MGISPVLKRVNTDGAVEYHLEFDKTWDGFDSFVRYLKKHWQAEVTEVGDFVYSRRQVLRSNGIPITVYHDSQIGNYFLREDGLQDQGLLEKIESDLIIRMS